MDTKYNIISLFSGAGGMDLGFIKSGFNVIWANDCNTDAVQTYKKNIGNHIVLGDITKIPTSEINKDNLDIDVVIGGFPCQGFSIANKNRSMQDNRNFLYLELLRVIKETKPKFFIAENVKGILSIEGGAVIKMIIEDFENLGYSVDYQLLNTAAYGIPQARERVIIMGNRLGLVNEFPKITHGDKEGLKKQKTVQESIDFLQDIETSNGQLEDFVRIKGEKIYNHIAHTNVADIFFGRKHEVNQDDVCEYLKKWKEKTNYSTKKIDELFGYKHTASHWFRKDNGSGRIPKPKDWYRLKELLGFDNEFDVAVTTFVEKPMKFSQSLRITNWNRPSDTITASIPEIHINKKRRLSVRECAIIQTFPNNFIFTGNLSSQHRQVGNAVPVLFAEKIADVIKEKLNSLVFLKNIN